MPRNSTAQKGNGGYHGYENGCWTLGRQTVKGRSCRNIKNIVEQDHRDIKRCASMLGEVVDLNLSMQQPG